MASTEALRVFISYARSDGSALAEELVPGLEVAGFEPFLDRHDIAAAEDWEARLHGLILASDTVVFVVSPASVASKRCGSEIEQALALSKRIIPVLAIAVPEDKIPPQLRRLNLIFFDEGKSYSRALAQLSEALRTDRTWIREHTRLAEIAARWRDRQENEVLLLRGSELEAAKTWLASHTRGAPEPTDLHRAFIKSSDAAEIARVNALEQAQSLERKRLAETAAAQADKAQALKRLSRRTAIGLGASGTLTVAAGGLAYWGVSAERRFQEEKTQRTLAEARTIDGTIEREAFRKDIAGQFSAYASAPGQTTPDNAAYSDALLEELSNRDTSLLLATSRANGKLFRSSKQRPYFSSDLSGDVYLKRPSPSRRCSALLVSVDNVREMRLANPNAIVTRWEDFLRGCGFVTTRLHNPSRDNLLEAAARFAENDRHPATEDTLALIYFSGGGFSLDNKSYLVPSDMQLGDEARNGVELAVIQNGLRAAAAASILFLDTNFPRIDDWSADNVEAPAADALAVPIPQTTP